MFSLNTVCHLQTLRTTFNEGRTSNCVLSFKSSAVCIKSISVKNMYMFDSLKTFGVMKFRKPKQFQTDLHVDVVFE